MSDSLQSHGLQHARPPCPTQTPGATQTHVHWVGDTIQSSHPLSSPSTPALNLSQHQIFSNESVVPIRWPKYWSFSINICPSSEHPGLISFRMDWLDLLAVQRTLNSLHQHHSIPILMIVFNKIKVTCYRNRRDLAKNKFMGVKNVSEFDTK